MKTAFSAEARIGPEMAAAPSAPPVHGEAGTIRLSFRRRGAATEAHETYQAGCLRVRLPRARGCEAVILNTGGGLVGGDRLGQRIRWERGSRATVTGQAAEKVYRTAGPVAEVRTELDVDADAEAEWLPQETILFDRARLRRRAEVRLARTASFTGIEAIVLGRTEMGERVTDGLLEDRWRIRRDGQLVYADALRLDGPIAALMERRAIGSGAAAMAVIIHVAEAAGSLLGQVRDALATACGLAAATAHDALLIVRLLAREGAALRHDCALALAALRGGRPLPRTWGC